MRYNISWSNNLQWKLRGSNLLGLYGEDECQYPLPQP